MKKKLIIIGIFLLATAFLFLNQGEKQEAKSQLIASEIEVVHFYGTQQCWSCIAVGEYALKTIQLKFPQEYSRAKLRYRDVNVDLPENSEIVDKYKARGSSLFINAIVNGEDNIEEDTTVWRLVSNEGQYMNYLENKLNLLLGKQK